MPSAMGQQLTSVQSYGAFESRPTMESEDEDAGLLYAEPMEAQSDDDDDDTYCDGRGQRRRGGYTSSSSDSVQEGVRKIEAISKTWTQKSLIIAYIGYVHAMIYICCLGNCWVTGHSGAYLLCVQHHTPPLLPFSPLPSPLSPVSRRVSPPPPLVT